MRPGRRTAGRTDGSGQPISEEITPDAATLERPGPRAVTVDVVTVQTLVAFLAHHHRHLPVKAFERTVHRDGSGEERITMRYRRFLTVIGWKPRFQAVKKRPNVEYRHFTGLRRCARQ